MENLQQKLALLCMVMVGLAQIFPCEAQTSSGDFLRLHNEVRKGVGIQPLVWDPAMEKYAKDYAQQRVHDCSLTHSGGPYGENIYAGHGEGYTDAKAAMKIWVDEKMFYNDASNTCADGRVCAHYTQIVWGNSKRLGCATSVCAGDSVFIICNYDPPGNIEGERPY